MLQKKDIETLRILFCSHNYVMTTAELTASKLYYADIKQLLDEGLIERVRRGYYHWTQDNGESEVVIINRLFPDAVLCAAQERLCRSEGLPVQDCRHVDVEDGQARPREGPPCRPGHLHGQEV